MILLTRPYPQSFAIGTVLKKKGLPFFIEPMLTVVPLKPVSLVRHQTLIITSRNALDFLESFRPNVTIYCVGQSLEALLREKGAVSVRSFASVLRLVEFIKTKNKNVKQLRMIHMCTYIKIFLHAILWVDSVWIERDGRTGT